MSAPFPDQKLVVATHNRDKWVELTALCAELPLEVVRLGELSEAPPVAETGNTFEANALLKAAHAQRLTGWAACADDSGLCVDALDGAPGVRSARFAGPEATDADNNAALVGRLHQVPAAQRTAHYVCVLALVTPTTTRVTRGRVDGSILLEPRGAGGFGYDPYFYCPELGATFAEAPLDAKGRVSHRGRALRQLVEVIAALLAGAPGADPMREKGGVDDGT